ncbi:MAG: anti-sigma-K factor RskA [Glaciecola sp.]|jgi:anti-sigma-K factor RskA
MKYDNPQLISALAAEYVLGTLRGKARERFEVLKFENEDIIKEIKYWESHLNAMALHLQPIEPREYVLENVRQRLGFVGYQINAYEAPAKTANVVEIKQNKTTRKDKSIVWKWWSGVATAAALVLAVLVSTNIELDTTQQVQSLAVINNEDAKTLWSIDVLANNVRVKVTSFVPKLPNNDYQLWIVPASGAAPISIGVMQQSGEFYLSKPVEFDNIDIAALAVSKEPKGGSPNGSPTEVLYAVELAFI